MRSHINTFFTWLHINTSFFRDHISTRLHLIYTIINASGSIQSDLESHLPVMTTDSNFLCNLSLHIVPGQSNIMQIINNLYLSNKFLQPRSGPHISIISWSLSVYYLHFCKIFSLSSYLKHFPLQLRSSPHISIISWSSLVHCLHFYQLFSSSSCLKPFHILFLAL